MKKLIILLFCLIFLATYSFAIVTVVDVTVTSVKIPIITNNPSFVGYENAECKVGRIFVYLELVKGMYTDSNTQNIIASTYQNTGFKAGASAHWAFDKVAGQQYSIRSKILLETTIGTMYDFSCTPSAPGTYFTINCNYSTGTRTACYHLGTSYDQSCISMVSNCVAGNYCIGLGSI